MVRRSDIENLDHQPVVEGYDYNTLPIAQKRKFGADALVFLDASYMVRTRFFRCALIVLGTVPEVRRCGTGLSEKNLGAEVQVRTICVSRCGGAVPDYPISSNVPSSAGV